MEDTKNDDGRHGKSQTGLDQHLPFSTDRDGGRFAWPLTLPSNPIPQSGAGSRADDEVSDLPGGVLGNNGEKCRGKEILEDFRKIVPHVRCLDCGDDA